jgi:hypothetical protein
LSGGLHWRSRFTDQNVNRLMPLRRDGSAGHVEVFQMSVQEPSSPGDLDPYPVTDAPSTPAGTTLDCEGPDNGARDPRTSLRLATITGWAPLSAS